MPEPRAPFSPDPGDPRRGGPPGTPGGASGGPPGSTLDEWVAEQVPPLPPPPGTLDRIRKRARQRKLVQAVSAAAGAAVIVLGIATLPQLVLSQLRPSSQSGGDVAGQTLLTAPPQPSARPSPAGSGTPAPTLPPVPPHFAPTSVTFVSTGTGWVIGQAGTPGQCGPPAAYICTSIARTDDGGRTWYGVPAPVTGAPDGSHGVSQLRFLNLADGWAFGPELWATHDSGKHWAQVPTHGLRVTALETRGATAYAVLARCHGGGAAYAADCTSFSLYSSPAASDNWQPVPGATAGLTAGGAPSSAQLLLTGTASYLLPPGGGLVAGPGAASGPWRPAAGGLLTGVPCSPGPPGQPGGALLAVTGADRLVVLCPGAGGSGGQVFASGDGGRTWQPAGQVTAAGTAASLSGSLTGALILATSQGIAVSPDGGGRWQPAEVVSAPPGGFSYVGMTTGQQGVAVPADPRQGAVWFTYDGGQTWRPSPVTNP